MTEHVVEWAPFSIRPGVAEAALIEASARVQKDFIAKQDGFVRRELIKGQDRGYVDIIWWRSMGTAEAAMAKVTESAACRDYFSLMEPNQAEAGAGVLHFRSLRTY
ncbi:MAG: hypothetical protein ACREEP_02170 [Dongiaceae bacterium]